MVASSPDAARPLRDRGPGHPGDPPGEVSDRGVSDRGGRWPRDMEDYDYEDYEEVSRKYAGLDDEMRVLVAKALTWIKKKGPPAVMAACKIWDPRFLVFADRIVTKEWESLEEARRRLKVNKKTVNYWFRRLCEEQIIEPETARFYGWGREERKGESLQPPRTSSARRRESLSIDEGLAKVKDMPEEEEKVVEIPEALLYLSLIHI